MKMALDFLALVAFLGAAIIWFFIT